MIPGEKELHDVVAKRRTIRQFTPKPVSRDTLRTLVEVARLAPSAANMQPLEFIVVDDKERCAKVFPCLKWAAYITPGGDPKPGQEPAAYVVTLVNAKIREKMFEYDVGAAMENMIIAAAAAGLGTCWLLSIDRDRLKSVLAVPDDYRIDSVLALGYPAEDPAVEEYHDSPKYWKDADGRLHVPKRTLATVLHINRF